MSATGIEILMSYVGEKFQIPEGYSHFSFNNIGHNNYIVLAESDKKLRKYIGTFHVGSVSDNNEVFTLVHQALNFCCVYRCNEDLNRE